MMEKGGVSNYLDFDFRSVYMVFKMIFDEYAVPLYPAKNESQSLGTLKLIARFSTEEDLDNLGEGQVADEVEDVPFSSQAQ